jgi:uncharacterized membrane protein YdjX (TVP38/TMEM64 family)
MRGCTGRPVVEQMVGREPVGTVGQVWRWLVLGMYLILIGGLAWLWHNPSTRQWFNQDALTAWGRQMLALPLGPLLVMAGYVVLVMLGMPVLVLITVGTLIFTPWPGMAYAMAGMLCGAMVTYGVGRFTGASTMDRWTSGRLARLAMQLRQRGLLAMIVVRVLPVAPFIMVNLLAGALRVRWRHYVLGTFLGLLPASIFIPLMLGQASALWKAPSPRSLAALAITAVVAVGVSIWLRRRLSGVTLVQGSQGD